MWLFVVTVLPWVALYLFKDHWTEYLYEAATVFVNIALDTVKGEN